MSIEHSAAIKFDQKYPIVRIKDQIFLRFKPWWIEGYIHGVDELNEYKSRLRDLYNEVTDIERNEKEMNRPSIIAIKKLLEQ